MPHPEPPRPFSRFMPPFEAEPWPLRLKLAVGALGVGAVAFAVALPPVAIGLTALYALADLSLRRHFKRMRADRSGESICTFARSFDRRTVDPWIVRAVWDDLQTYVSTGGCDFPVRASDVIDLDLRVDVGDIDDIADRAAQRAGRSMADTASNPLYGSVRTAGDLVRFLNAQPVVGAA